jgi:O-methyltransferase
MIDKLSFTKRMASVLADPRRIRQVIRNRIRELPFRLRLTSMLPGSYRAYVPDRYWVEDDRNDEGAARQSEAMKGFLTGNQVNNSGDFPRYFFLQLVCEQIAKEQIGGDVAELGVYKGNTAVLLSQFARRFGTTAYLLDTFGGFSGKDLVGIDADKRATAQFTDTSLNGVKALVGERNVKYVQGRFPESASEIPDEARFGLVHIDCDLYAPIRAALEFFYPRLVSGGFLIVHDYSCLCWNGAEKAVDEFFADKPEKVIPIPDKSGTAVIRRTAI